MQYSAQDTVSERVRQSRFAKFRSGDTTSKGRKCAGKPLVIDDNQIDILIKNNARYTTR